MKAATSNPAGAALRTAGEEAPGLVRAIGRWTMVALMINMIVGAGIFGLPARVHAQAGVYGLWAYAACAVVIACIALCLAEVASRFTGSGGPYLYATEAFGPLPGFLVGWLMVATRMTSLALIANVMADYLAYFWPAAGAGPIHSGVMVAALLVLAVINWLGVREGAGVATALTIGKLVPLLLFIGVGLLFLDARRFVGAPAPPGSALTQVVLQLVFAFGGFEAAVVNAGEMKEPRRDVPFALGIGIGAATLLYVLIQTVCIGTLPELASSRRPLADAAARFAGGAGGAFIALGAFVSAFGALGGTILSGPRVLFAMAERRQIPEWFGRLHSRFRTPHAAILALTAGGVALAVTGTFTSLLSLNVITRLIQYLVTALAVGALRRRAPGQAAPFAMPAAIVVVPVTAIACLWLIARSSVLELRSVAVALGLGLTVYAARVVWLLRRRRDAKVAA
jgi:amino acid transporter